MLAGWNPFGVGVGDVVNQRAECRGAGNGSWFFAARERCGVEARQQACGDGFGVAFDARELAGKENWSWFTAPPRGGLQAQRFVEQCGRADVGVAMNLPVAQEARVFEAGDEAQDAGLVAPLEVVLEADEVVAVSAQILFAQLHDGPRSVAGARIAEAHGFHGAEPQGVSATARKNLDGQAALEVVELFPFLALGRLGGEKRIEEAVVFLAIHGAVDVVGGALVPARSKVDAAHVDGLGIDDG